MNNLTTTNFEEVLNSIPAGDNDANTSEIIQDALYLGDPINRNLRVAGIDPSVDGSLVLSYLKLGEDYYTVFVAVQEDDDDVRIRTLVKRPGQAHQIGGVDRTLTAISTLDNGIVIDALMLARLNEAV